MNKEFIKLSIGIVELIEPSIVRIKVNEGALMDVKETHEIREANLKLNNGEPFCALLDAGVFFTTTNEARIESATPEFSKHRIAIAIVTKSLPMRLLGNFYIKFNKPPTPTRLFADEKDGLNWLRGFLEKNNSISNNHMVAY